MLFGLKESNRLPTKPHFCTSFGEAEDGEVNGESVGEMKEGNGKANGVSLVEGDDNDEDDEGENFEVGLQLRLRKG